MVDEASACDARGVALTAGGVYGHVQLAREDGVEEAMIGAR